MSGDDRSEDEPLTYAKAGVDIDAGAALVEAIKPLARATSRPGSGGDLGGFGALFDLKAAGFKDPVLVATSDGVGTKVKIAIESGRNDTIGIDLVAMCVNDLIVQGAEPLFFLDYFACSKLDVATARAVIAGIADGCRQAGAALIGGETAEMPGLYASGDYDLAGFAVGAAERGALLPRGDVEIGDVVIGIFSEGLHSNGFSLVRRLVADAGLDWHATAPYERDKTLAESLLVPTRIYVKSVLTAIRETGAVKALAHITGGGLLENLPRVLPGDVAAEIDLAAWKGPAVFQWIAQEGRVSDTEMLRTFNCGIGLVILCAERDANGLLNILERQGERGATIGKLVQRNSAASVRFGGSLFRV